MNNYKIQRKNKSIAIKGNTGSIEKIKVLKFQYFIDCDLNNVNIKI